jgi:hypothetical protein
MTTTLEELLDDIHPSKTIDATSRRAAGAIAHFTSMGVVENPEALLDLLVPFKHCCFREMLDLSDDPPEANAEFERSQCRDILTKAFGANGFRVAADMAMSGAEGGLHRVLKEFATALAGQFTQNEIAAKVNGYWNDLTTEEKLSAPEEYLEKYRHVIPPGYEWNVRGHFREALLKHPMMIQRLERVVRD